MQYLTPEQQDCIKNNKHPAGIDTSQLTESLENFKQNPLTLGFIQGLFDGDGCITVSLTDLREGKAGKAIINLTVEVSIAQDTHNISLANEVRGYFKDIGYISDSDKSGYSKYRVHRKSDLRTVISPMLAGKEPNDLIKKYNIDELELPLIKYNKLYHANKILELELYTSGFKDKKDLKDIIRLLYPSLCPGGAGAWQALRILEG